MNRAQKRQLQAYIHFRDKRMSLPALIQFNWRIFSLVAAAGVGSVGSMLYFHAIFQAWVLAAAYGAIMLRDIGQCIRWSRTWPMTNELLDWAKVERLALENNLGA
jgi:hypothetical protein